MNKEIIYDREMNIQRCYGTEYQGMKVKYIDHMGSDLSVVNSAYASFGKMEHEYNPDKHDRLIQYLSRGMGEADFEKLADNLAYETTDAKVVAKALWQFRNTPTHFCYDDKTEIITPSGWKLFRDLTNDDLVGQVDYSQETMILSWVKPSHIVREPFNGSLLGCKGTTIDYAVTPNHRMLLKPRTSSGEKPFEVKTALEVHNKDFKVSTTARLSQQGIGSYQEGLLYGFLLADGFVSYQKVKVRLKRQRKVEFLTNLLNDLGTEFKLTISMGVYVFSFYHELRDKIGTATTKKLCVDYINSSTDYLQGIYDGYMQGDGSKKHKQYCFSSSSITLFNDICFLSSVLGYQPFVNKPRHSNNPNHNVNYRGNISSRTRANTRLAEFYELPYNGKVYCVTVPTGMVLVRRNGVQLVSGNSPFAHTCITLQCTVPIAIHAQLVKHTVGFNINTVSRRYVSTKPELFIPEFRSKPTGNIKQGSGDVHERALYWQVWYKHHAEASIRNYVDMVDAGIAPEQARFVLPQGVMTEFVWTGNVASFARMFNQRTDSHSQKEIQDLAHMVGEIIEPLYPVSWNALTGN